MQFQVSARRVCLALSCLLVAGGTARAQLPPFTSATLPDSTWAGVVPGPGGVLYGVTYEGGTFGKGTIFKITRDLSTLTILHHLTGAQGSTPYAELTVGTGTAAGKLFGTTSGYPGTLFSFDLATNTLSVLVTFPGSGPFVPLLQVGEYLYGSFGGTGPGCAVFRVRIDGTGYETIKEFPVTLGAGGWEGPDGMSPGALTLGPDGFLYGAANTGGDASCYPGYGCGTLFRLRSTGADFSVLRTFTAPAFPAGFPNRKLIYSGDGWLYGTSFRGVFRARPSGSDFSMIYTLPGGAGSQIFSPPVEGTDGRLYVTQYDGGPAGAGRVFSVRKDGTDLQVHHDFTFTSGGSGPYGILYRDSAGTLFNTTEYSSSTGDPGTVFAIRGTNSEPVAIATAPSPVAAGAGCVAVVTLNGSGSSDPDGDPLTYVWKEGGATIATGATPVVSLPVGLHTITLVVTDSFGAFDTMDVTVQVTGSAAIAYAGPALLQQFGPNTLSATLTAAGVPAAGIAVTFTVNGVALPAATTDATGTAQVVATIGGSGATATIQVAAPPSGCGSATDTAVVPVNRWPTLAVSATTPVVAGPTCTAPVTLDATGTSDLDGDALAYAWTEGPATLATTRTATVALAAGSHSVVLTVSDGRGGVSTTTVGVLVAEEPSAVQYTGPVVFASGVPTAATALLRTAAGVPLAGQSVRFTLGGLFFGTTDASGIATATVTAGAPGPATLRAAFLGDACHAPALVDTPVTVTPPTATLIVTKIVVNDGGGTRVPGDFTLLVSGSGPVPSSFPGSAAGTTVLLNPGAYTVSELPVAGYAGTFGAGCSGTITAGETKTCTVTNDDVTLNLQVAALKAPAAVAPGAALTVTDTTANVGIGAVPATATRVWISSDKLVGGGDTLLGTRAVPVLAGGAKSTGATPAVLPALAPGVYYLLAQADATGAVAESSEADNTRAKTLVVGPDLVVTAITTVPSAPVSTAPTTIAVTTRNNGGAASGPTLTRLYRSVNGKVDPTDPVLATFVVPGLDPGASDTQSVTVTLPAGGYNLLGLCDADGTEAEARETNNRRRLALVVP